MESLTCRAPAKVNFFLRVGEKKSPNGLHKIQSLIRKVGIFDKIYFNITGGDYNVKVIAGENIKKSRIKFDIESISNENNIAVKAAKSFFERAGIFNRGIDILIEKNIPFNAGLGGGSSDAAGLLLKLNEKFGGILDKTELRELALKTGSDVPFFLSEGDAIVSGFGEDIEEIKAGELPRYYIALIIPDFGVSTKEAYSDYDDFILTNNINYYNIHFLDFKHLEFINDFERVIFDRHPVLKEIKESLILSGAEGALLSGSGSAIFGAFRTEEKARLYLDNLKSFLFYERINLSFLTATL